MSENVERRYCGDVELRVEDGEEGKPSRIKGYAAVFNRWSPVYRSWIGPWKERIDPGFFDDVLGGDTRALFNHDPNFVLGRTGPKTLRLKRDDVGLLVDIQPPDTTLVREMVVEPMKRGDITGASFAFRLAPRGDAWAEGADGILERTLLKAIRLDDVSPVTFPFYPQANLAVRAEDDVAFAGASDSYKAWKAERDEGEAREREAAALAVAEQQHAEYRRRMLEAGW
jgi:HK97 family phage prohead protease